MVNICCFRGLAVCIPYVTYTQAAGVTLRTIFPLEKPKYIAINTTLPVGRGIALSGIQTGQPSIQHLLIGVENA